jgi:hypothetical protein
MPLNTFTVAFMGIALILGVTLGIIKIVIRIIVKNPAQWKSVKLVSDWTDIDPVTGNKIKRTQTEYYRVRV